MDIFFQRLFDACANGSAYAALAVAISLVFRASGVLNLAQGELAMFSSYLAVLFATDPGPLMRGTWLVGGFGTPWPIWASIAAAIVISAAIGALLERFVIRPLDDTTSLPAVGATLGLFLLVHAIAVQTWGTRTRILGSPFPTESSDHFKVAGGRLKYETIGITLTLVVVLAVLSLIQQRTKLGLAFRAVTSNRAGALLVGIHVDKVVMIGWAIAAGLGGLAGGLIANRVLVGPNMMSRLLLFALAAAIIGGLGNPTGAVIGGFVVAIAETMMTAYIGWVNSEMAVIWALGAVILVLSFRPEGLGPRRTDAVANR